MSTEKKRSQQKQLSIIQTKQLTDYVNTLVQNNSGIL